MRVPDRPLSPRMLLRALHRRCRDLGLPPPAAFLGHWRDAAAVLVPSVGLDVADPEHVFTGSDRLVGVGDRSVPDAAPGRAPVLPGAGRGGARGFAIGKRA